MFDHELFTRLMEAVVQAIRDVPDSHNRPVETVAVLGVLFRASLDAPARGGQPALDSMVEAINDYPLLRGAPVLRATVATVEEQEMDLARMEAVGRA